MDAISINSFIAPCVTALLTAIGVYAGIVKQLTKLETKMDDLAKQVEKHNSIVERTFKLESDMSTQWRRYDELKERVERLEDVKIGGTS